MPLPRHAAKTLALLPLLLTLGGCIVATRTETSRGSRVVTVDETRVVEDGPQLMAPPEVGGERATPRPVSKPAPRAVAADDGPPELMAPPEMDDGPAPRAEPKPAPRPAPQPERAPVGSSAYDQAVGCAAAMTALLNSQTYAMSQREADAMLRGVDAWRTIARSISGKADDDITARSRQLSDLSASRTAASCPPAP